MKMYKVNGKKVKANSVIDAVKKVKDSKYEFDGTQFDIDELKDDAAKYGLDVLWAGYGKTYFVKGQKEDISKLLKEYNMPKEVVNIKDSNPLVQEVANLIKGVDSIFSAKIINTLEDHGYTADYGQTPSGYAVTAKKNGKTVCIISKNSVYPNADDIVQGNFVIGLIDSKTCKDTKVKLSWSKLDYSKEEDMKNALSRYGVKLSYNRSNDCYELSGTKEQLRTCLSSYFGANPNDITFYDSKTCKDESTKEKLIKLWAYEYGQSIAEAKMHINAMTPEEIERKYKVLSQGQNSNAKKAFYEDSKCRDKEVKMNKNYVIIGDYIWLNGEYQKITNIEWGTKYAKVYIGNKWYEFDVNKTVELKDSAIKDAKYSFKLDKKKNEYGEYTVKCYKDGMYNEAGTYYTEDYEDALGTLKDLAKRSNLVVKQQGSVVVADSATGLYNVVNKNGEKVKQGGNFESKEEAEVFAAQYGEPDLRVVRDYDPVAVHAVQKKINELNERIERIEKSAGGKETWESKYLKKQLAEYKENLEIARKQSPEFYGPTRDAKCKDTELVITMNKARENLPDIDSDLHWYNSRYGSLEFSKNDTYLFVKGDKSDLDKFKKEFHLNDSKCRDTLEKYRGYYIEKVGESVDVTPIDEWDSMYPPKEHTLTARNIIKKTNFNGMTIAQAKNKIDNILMSIKDSAKETVRDTSTIKAEELKVGDIIYSRYDNAHPELVKCRVDKIIRRSGLLNIQLSEVESGNYFKTTQVVPEATFIKDSVIKDESMFMILNKDEGAYLYNVDISAARYRLTNNANKADKFTLSEANRIINILKKYNFDNLTTSEFLDSKCKDFPVFAKARNEVSTRYNFTYPFERFKTLAKLVKSNPSKETLKSFKDACSMFERDLDADVGHNIYSKDVGEKLKLTYKIISDIIDDVLNTVKQKNAQLSYFDVYSEIERISINIANNYKNIQIS